jgi:hypothetical protein
MMKENEPGTMIVQFQETERALEEAHTIIEVKDIRDQAEALRQCVKIAGYGLEYQNWVAEIKIRAERRAGEMLEELIPASGGRPRKNLDTGDRFSESPTLTDLGITYYQSRRWRLEASVPQDIFNLYVTFVKERGDELTSAGLLRLAKHLKQQEQEGSAPDAQPTAKRAKRAPDPSACLYQDKWLTLWDAELEEPHFIADNTLALVVTDGKKSRYYILEAMHGFIVTAIRK